MTRNEILQNLCYHDLRNPENIYDEDRIIPKSCHCDHCFYGVSELAEESLRLFDENEELKNKLNT